MSRAPAILALAIALGAGSASAAKEPRADRPGRVFFARGEANFNRGNFEQARADYQAAYEAEPLPAFLFNIAQCYRNLGDYERAQFFYQRYTMLDPHSPNRPAAERLIAEMNRLAAERDQQRATTQPPLLASATSPAVAAPASGDHAAPPLLGPPVADTRATASRPLYRRPWFWVGLGGAIVAGTAAAFALSRETSSGTLPPIDARGGR
jgi:tetratricopeptide (TPR) repeat protein